MKWLKVLANIFLFLGIPVLGFFGGYRMTDIFFQTKKIPYPFELFGVVVGSATCLFIFGLIHLVFGIAKQYRSRA